ncbi:hypothetical protein SS50377_24870 [Spironucleus salmonicida]|uniref:Transmembrane protein n=1 Tax=Spironucleus salmonicida TaxID=348837 RepID=A0A9P8LRK1_9EUKA|nr:hypothetical protein SS50377_24870 [Spironucleus salmonicida]
MQIAVITSIYSFETNKENILTSSINETLSEPLKSVSSGILDLNNNTVFTQSDINAKNLGFFTYCEDLTIQNGIFRIQLQNSKAFSTFVYCANAKKLILKNIIVIYIGRTNAASLSLTQICQECQLTFVQIGGNIFAENQFSLLSAEVFNGNITKLYISLQSDANYFLGLSQTGNINIYQLAMQNTVQSKNQINLLGQIVGNIKESYIQTIILSQVNVVIGTQGLDFVNIRISTQLQFQLLQLPTYKSVLTGLISNTNIQNNQQFLILNDQQLKQQQNYHDFDLILYQFYDNNFPRFKDFILINDIVKVNSNKCDTKCICIVLSSKELLNNILILKEESLCKETLSIGIISGITFLVVFILIIIILIIVFIIAYKKKPQRIEIYKCEHQQETEISVNKDQSTVLRKNSTFAQIPNNKTTIIEQQDVANKLRSVQSREYISSVDYPREIQVNLVSLQTMKMAKNTGFTGSSSDGEEIVTHLPGNTIIMDRQLQRIECNSDHEDV